MDDYDYESERRKKRRRREIAPRPIDARLNLDDSIRSNAAIVSPSLWASIGKEFSDNDASNDAVPSSIFVAITPSTPLYTSIEDAVWTILPAQLQYASDADNSSQQQHLIRLNPKSPACSPILKAFAATDQNRHGAHIPKTIDIKIVTAKPLVLDTIYVSVERDLLEKVDEIQSKFGGGFNHYGRGAKPDKRLPASATPAQATPAQNEDRMRTLVREGLAQRDVVYAGDLLHLPLPSHPITHVRPPPAIIIESEPVSQGKVSSNTKIVLLQAGSLQEKAIKRLLPAQPIIEESLEDTAEDTSNDQFFSAAEDRHATTASELDGASDEGSSSEEPEKGGSDDDSDSMEDIISLSAPGLPPQQAGTLSAMTAATPRPGEKRYSGTHTPGSIYSSFTTTTARTGSRPGKVFRTEPLLRKVPVGLLHPKPLPEDDEETFVFVDTSTLAKIGCFSGDWVRIELARNVSSGAFPSIGISNLNGLSGDEESDWRAVRIFGLSGLRNQKPRYTVDKRGDRKSSFSQKDSLASLTPVLYLSPVLLANLSNVQFVKVGVLPKPPQFEARNIPSNRLTANKSPPTAKEVKLLKISTPMTTSREMQSALFSGLKGYFEHRKRVLKKGDLIAIPIDQDLSKTMSTSETTEGNATEDEIINKLRISSPRNFQQFFTAWFFVQYIEADDRNGSEQTWGGVAVVDALSTRTSREGDKSQPVSELTEKWTKYWLGIATVPQQNTVCPDVVVTTSSLPPFEKLPLEKRLADLITASTSPRAASLRMSPLVILLHSTQRQVGKTFTAVSACADAGVHTFAISSHALLSENASTTGGGDVKTEATLRARAERALTSGAQNTVILIQDIDVLTADRIIPALQEIIASSRVLIATSSKIDDIPDGVRSLFTHELEITAPDESAREVILRNAVATSSTPLSPSVNLKSVALQTAALVAGDLLDVVDRAMLARSTRFLKLAEDQLCTISDIHLSGGQFTSHLLPSDFSDAISAARSTFSDAIGAPKIPTVTWKDVGGLSSQKDAIMETISLPLTHPELFANGIRKRSGILFYGPPGTGKTLLAKAIATEFSLNFFSVKGPELLNMYIGESEANVRRVFQRARDARPCVVFFDELDSVAPKRGNQGDSGGVMDRIVSQLLAELDGMSSSSGSSGEDAGSGIASSGGGVFVIGATNRPDLLDPALLRPGRFDKMLYLGVADTHDQQVTILKALTRKFTLAPSVDLNRIASRLPFTYTGADLYALCSDAMLKSITRKTKAVDEKVQQISKQRGEEISTGYFFDHLATDEDVQVVVEEQDFGSAQQELVGSVSQKELEHFERIRSMFEEQDISAGTTQDRNKNVREDRKRTSVLPLRPGQPPNSIPTAAQSLSQPGYQRSHPNENVQQPQAPLPAQPQKQYKETKGKGRQKEQPSLPAQFRKQAQIGNPDSSPGSDYDADVARDSGYGINSTPFSNGIINGVSPIDVTSRTGLGKEKGKAQAMEYDGDENDYSYSYEGGHFMRGGIGIGVDEDKEEEEGLYD